MLQISGVNRYVTKTAKQKAQVKRGAENLVKRMARTVLKDLVLNAPQWSGETASSWRIDLNYRSASESRGSSLKVEDWTSVLPNPSYKGDSEAWVDALAANTDALKAIKYNSKVRLVNISPYAVELATGDSSGLRRGNFIPGDVMAINYVTAKYHVSSDILSSQLKEAFTNG